MVKIAIQTFPLFSVPITIANLGREAKGLNSRLVADILKEQETKEPIKTRSVVRGWQSAGGLEKEYESFSELSDLIMDVFNNILPSYGFPQDFKKDYRMGDFWANILDSLGAFNMPHIHGTGETVFSGVYYPTSGLLTGGTANQEYYDENYNTVQLRADSHPISGDLVLFDPASDIKRQVIPGNVNRHPYYGQEICIEPRESHLVIFPNYLKHMVAPITLPNFKRISISFAFTKKA